MAKEGEHGAGPPAVRRIPDDPYQLHGVDRPGRQRRPLEHLPSARPAASATWASARRSAASVMNPNDHPHGGGEGKSPIGRPGPVTPWGKPTLGYKTRKTKNPTSKFIVKRRNAK